ncbi:hypothetical protein [Helicobacter mastomyrinus]|mgnify:FL=1|uniref:Uncharacterized protein n=1 Tax=Helicobacter mastomyrinus TaxID=287948 RepID=A0ABZ3F7T1_9HELI|nr:hypothetical protein [uncultured Helicobacter sp.]
MQDWEKEFLALFGEHERAREYAQNVRNAKKAQAQRNARKKVLKKPLIKRVELG